MKRITFKKKIAGLISMTMLAIAVVVPIVANPKTADSRWECTPMNVINCGVDDKTDLVNQINNGDGVHTDIKGMFQNMGIIPEDISNQNTLGGVVTRDGRVVLTGGQVVATNVLVGERATVNRTGTPWQGLVWNYMPNALAPADPQESAYIYMYNGQFQYAILLTCGNPVFRTLTPIPPHITITKEVRNVTANPSATTFSETVPANIGDVVRFRIKVLNNGTITDEAVKIGDILPQHLTLEPNTAQVVTPQLVNNAWQKVTTNISDTEALGGKGIGNLIPNQDAFMLFNAKVTGTLPAGCTNLINRGYTSTRVIGNIYDTAGVNVCLASPPTPPTPPTPPVTPPTPPVTPPTPPTPGQPTSLPASGPVEAAGGVMGTGALGYAGYLWRRSRKTLMNTLLNK